MTSFFSSFLNPEKCVPQALPLSIPQNRESGKHISTLVQSRNPELRGNSIKTRGNGGGARKLPLSLGESAARRGKEGKWGRYPADVSQTLCLWACGKELREEGKHRTKARWRSSCGCFGVRTWRAGAFCSGSSLQEAIPPFLNPNKEGALG